MSEPRDKPLDDTIARIRRLDEPHEDAADAAAPPESYADTMTGKELAAIVGGIRAEHETLESGASENVPAAQPGGDTLPPVTPEEGASPGVAGLPDDETVMDEISSLVRVMEGRLRARVREVLEARNLRLEADYKDKLRRVHELSRQQIALREAAIRDEYADRYRSKEELLRSYYKKLIAVANKVSRQKAQLQQARRQFEAKLESANRLYQEVDEMRTLLTNNIDYLDRESEDVPEPPDSI